jgi:hypothetical protein
MPDFDTRVPHNARVYNYLLGSCFPQTHTNPVGYTSAITALR